MEVARQRVRAVAAHKKEEERRAKGKEGASLSAPKAISKGLSKRKVDGKDDHPPKKAVVTPRDAHLKKKSPSSQVKSRRGLRDPVIFLPIRTTLSRKWNPS